METPSNHSLICHELVNNKLVISVQILVPVVASLMLCQIDYIFLQNKPIFSWVLKITLILYFFIILKLHKTIKKLFSVQGEVMLICQENGIWFKHFGNISWDDIAEIDEFRLIPFIDELRFPGIRFKDPQKISKQANWQGKMQLGFSRIFLKNCIVFPQLDVPFKEISYFIKSYKK